jgi:hypothetical protein
MRPKLSVSEDGHLRKNTILLGRSVAKMRQRKRLRAKQRKGDEIGRATIPLPAHIPTGPMVYVVAIGTRNSVSSVAAILLASPLAMLHGRGTKPITPLLE